MSSSDNSVPKLSPFAEHLLRIMGEQPSRIEYHARVLGGMFRDEGIKQLDDAYTELRQAGLVTSAGTVISFFGSPKVLYKLTQEGKDYLQKGAA